MRLLQVTLLLAVCWIGGCSTKFREEAARDVASGSQTGQSAASRSVNALALSTGQASIEQLVQLQQVATEQLQEMDQLV